MMNPPRIPSLVADTHTPFHRDASRILAIVEKRRHNLAPDPAR